MVQIDENSVEAIANRLKRAQGQLGAVIRMLEEGQDCEQVVTQISAVNKAVSRAGYAMITAGLNECYKGKKAERDIDLKKLEKLFMSLA